MRDWIIQRAQSPDGHYVAVLTYRKMESRNSVWLALATRARSAHVRPAKVAEARGYGIEGMHWAGNRTLVVDYETDEALLLRRPSWGTVRVVYHRLGSR